MKNKILLLSTVILLGTWYLFSPSSSQISANQSTKAESLSRENLPKKTFESQLNVKGQNASPIIELDSKEEHVIVDCYVEESINDEEFERYYDLAKNYLKSLSVSSFKDKQLGYTLFAEPSDDKTRFDLLIEYNEKFPNNPLILKEIIRSCTESSNSIHCNSDFMETSIALDKNNGATWLQLIFFNASRDNDEAIVDSIHEMVKSSYFDDGVVKRVKIYLEALKDLPDSKAHLNIDIAMGEAIKLPAYSTLTQWCKLNINDTVKADACLQLGYYMEKNSKLLIDQMIGIAMQKLIFEAQGNTKSFEKADSEYKKVMEIVRKEQSKKAYSALASDEKLLSSWLDNFEDYGEYAAFKMLVEEAIELSKIENHSQCEWKK